MSNQRLQVGRAGERSVAHERERERERGREGRSEIGFQSEDLGQSLRGDAQSLGAGKEVKTYCGGQVSPSSCHV